ncbi:hypothetical protein [Oryzifoliimicrobium ureilyticus]|uniref:hypothetical protein n=1 Tax=Oryzifoliimicrobium ureilyticus TaxID=3113724 RepID=UPI0030762C4E
MKFRYLILAAVMAFAGPVLAAPAPATTVKSVTTSASASGRGSGFGTNSGFLTLGPGNYILNLTLSGAASSVKGAALLTEFVSGRFLPKYIAGLDLTSVGMKSFAFSVTGKSGLYALTTAVTVRGGNGVSMASVQKVAAVPGPEAGAGIGALAMGGLAVYLRRRRTSEALAA